jgi:hypothetical protein
MNYYETRNETEAGDIYKGTFNKRLLMNITRSVSVLTCRAMFCLRDTQTFSHQVCALVLNRHMFRVLFPVATCAYFFPFSIASG